MAAKLDTLERDSGSSLALLETRLRRLEFLLTGNSNLDGVPHVVEGPQKITDSAAARVLWLHADLDKLRRAHGPAGGLIRDIESIHARVPEASTTTAAVSIDELSTKASLVLSHATLYPETASRLSSLQTLQIPPAEQSAKLCDLRLGIKQAQRVQDSLENNIQDLRQRSARCLEWWVKTGIVGMGDLWEEWELRIADVERYLTRVERRKEEREGYL